ncbi:transcriptional coactivator p15/PC4 family protein [Candidatus Pacearchaeota archaeon]|nr:transcriptional coactivator p15/PC4 family protein [Candidatus Pacearchaeota archaeon]MBI2057133.1 transcriptional coactivator p15/PC4 family protein [Candidatus Pacearchaeota archaeon]
MEKDIGKIKKGEYQGTVTEIVVGVREYNGRVGVDIREFASSEKYTGPTKKGLRIPAENFKDFKKMINSITDEDLVASEPSEAPANKSAGKSKPGQEELPDY